MINHPSHGFKRLINAVKYSAQGVIKAFKGEAAFREEIMITVILITLAYWLDVSAIERVLLSGQAKDMGSAAVMFSVIICVITWWEILG